MKKLTTFFAFMMILILASCSGDTKEKIQGTWYSDFTKETQGINSILGLEFKDTKMELSIEMPDFMTVKFEGDYSVNGKDIEIDLNSTPKVELSVKFTSYLSELGIPADQISMMENTMKAEMTKSTSEISKEINKLTVDEVTEGSIKVTDEAKETRELFKKKPSVGSALPAFKKMIGA